MHFKVCAAVAIFLGTGFGPSMTAGAAEVKVNPSVVDPRTDTGVSVSIGEGAPSATSGISVFPRLGAGRLTVPASSPEALRRSETVVLSRSDEAALRREFPLMEGGGETLPLEVAVSVRDDHGHSAVGDGEAVNEWTGMLDGAPTAFTPPSQNRHGTPVDGWVSILD